MFRSRDLYTRWRHDIRERKYFHAGERVGIAVSGGPDSVLLLHFMHQLANTTGLTLAAVHFNHRLRGAESDGDEAMVRELSASLNIAYLRSEADVKQLAHERRGNVEGVARELRYGFFLSLVDQGQLDLVATAHTANDQAETVLMRLLRGSGTRGLGGIYPVLDGKVVRPFLGLTRPDVIQEIAARQIAYRTDSTNLDTHLLRNKVRFELLPLLAREYNPEILVALNQLAERARDEEALLEQLARDQARSWRISEASEERIPIPKLEELSPALVRRILRQTIEWVKGAAGSLTHTQVESIRRFASQSQSGKALEVPGFIGARKDFTTLVISRVPPNRTGGGFLYPVTAPGEVAVKEIGTVFRFKILTREDIGRAYNQSGKLGLDPQKLSGELTLRNWQAGDVMSPVGRRGSAKLKELFRERKIPRLSRQGWPVLLCAGRIVWTRGFPVAKDAAASGTSPRVMVVEEEPMQPT